MQYGRTHMPDGVFNVIMITGFIMAALILLALYFLSRSGKKGSRNDSSKGASPLKKSKKSRLK